MYEKLPACVKEKGLFCLWRYETRDRKRTKVPYRINGRRADSSSKGSFSKFDDVYAKVQAAQNRYAGIGISTFSGFGFVDIDDCVGEDGQLSPMALDIVDTLCSYTETSPSGKGIRIIVYPGDLVYDTERYYINNRKIHLEIYIPGATDKFVTLTGNPIREYGVSECPEELHAVLEKYMVRPMASFIKQYSVTAPGSYLTDESVLVKAFASKQAEKFKALWEGNIPEGKSQSEADMSLAMMLAFWCGGDIEQMDRLFRESKLMRDKWDRRQSGSTYGRLTLEKAVSMTMVFYEPFRDDPGKEFDDVYQNIVGLQPESNERYGWNDNGYGRLFADVFRPVARFVPERNKWFVYDGMRWVPDIGGLKVMELCKELADKLVMYALTIKDERTRKDYLEHCTKWQNRRTRLTIISDAASVHPISIKEFDADPYLFNCSNGILDLRNREFRPHDPEDLLTMLSGVSFNPNAENLRFAEFINEIMSGDRDKSVFLQKALGYATTGDTRYECMFILYGASTRNGKGTLMESVLKVMGDYGKAVRPETIAHKNTNSQNPSEDIARLAGVRLANISEPGRGLMLNAAQVKSMTGNDTLNARFLHENSFDFKPQFKLYINTNHLPFITDMTVFSSNRLYIIPFDRHFEPQEQDKTLKSEFAKPDVQSAILNWLVEGYEMLTKEGLEPPKAVADATEAYEQESDKVQMFIDECLEPKPGGELRTQVVYSLYRDWCTANGLLAESLRNFNQNLQKFGQIVRRRPRGGGGMTTLFLGFAEAKKPYEFLA